MTKNKILIKLSVDRKWSKTSFDCNVIFSNSKHDEKIKDVKKWFYIPKDVPTPIRINNSFWLINNWIDQKMENSYFTKDNTIIFIDLSQIEIDIEKLKNYIKDLPGLEILDNNLLEIRNIDFIRIPMKYWFAENNEWLSSEDFVYIWIYSIFKKFFKKVKIDSSLEEIFENIEFSTAKNSIKHIWEIENYVNGGNEGYITYENSDNKYLIKTIGTESDSIENSIRKKLEYSNTSVQFAENEMIIFNSEINLQKINKHDRKLSYKYLNILLPTSSFKTSQMISLLKKQKEAGIIITDVKIDNFAKIPLENGFSKIIYSDFGKSFVKFRDQNDYDDFFIGNIRDYYFFAMYYKSYRDYRKIIRDSRMIVNKNLFKDKLKLFMEQVYSNRDNILYLCHDEIPNDIDLKKYDIRICSERSRATLFIERREKDDYVYDLYNDKICNCDKQKGMELAKELGLKNKGKVQELDNTFKKVIDSNRYE